ncbi:MAG: ATP-binding protein [Micrococcales bacterium]|nr:ATP-binding protein [Micrococcales bacterium]
MLRRLNVSTKVRVVLAVPMIVLLVAGSYIGWGAYQDFRVAQTNSAVVRSLDKFQVVADAIRAEQVAPAGQERDTARSATENAVADFKRAADEVALEWLPEQSAQRFAGLAGQIDGSLDSARRMADQSSQETDAAYMRIIASEQGFVRSWAVLMADRTLAQWVTGHDDLFTFTIAIGNQARAGHALIAAVQEAAADPEATVNPEVLASYLTLDQFSEVARTNAVTSLGDLPDNLDALIASGSIQLPSGKTLDFARSELQTSATGKLSDEQGNPTLTEADWNQLADMWLTQVRSADQTLLDKATDVAAQQATTAMTIGGITLGVLLLALALALLIASMVARAITRPLAHLTTASGEVRQQLTKIVEQVSVPGEGPEVELPRVPVETDDEIGQLATAFNEVNATTIQVAQEQAALRGSIAEMFVNVARRDQVLLNRQLAFVDSLERSEEDPTVLANLFHLDHLATRMRRNAESLLVLAGIDSGRRLRESMPLSDVIRTASSEIEQYDRVELDLNVDPLMLGFNALPAAHMLAELLENASVFSEPDTPVEVSTGMTELYVTVSVLDHGIGMTESEIVAVNEKLASTSPGDALGAQRLGLFVVARLARRLGAEVEIRRSPSGPGTETLVRFPIALFAGLDSENAPAGQIGAPMVDAYQPTYETAEVPSYGAPASSDDLAAAYDAQAVPVATEVDLAALTDGATDQGLPRRRATAAEEEAGAFVLPPTVQAHDLPSNLAAAPADGFTPMMSAGAGLPSRRREAAEPAEVIPPLDLTQASPVDPESRQGLFTGFRGWSRTQAEDAEAAQRPSPFAQRPAWDAPAEPAAQVEAPVEHEEQAAGYDDYPVAADEHPVAERHPMVEQSGPLTQRRGRHSQDPGAGDVPFGHTEAEVAAWRTGPIPSSEPTDDSDWPSEIWHTAPWKPAAGLFSDQTAEDGSLVPSFDPHALDADAPYSPAAFEASETPLSFGAGEAPTAFPADAAPQQPAWDEEPAWQPVMDISSTPLAPVDGAHHHEQPQPPMADQAVPSWPAAVEPAPVDPGAQGWSQASDAGASAWAQEPTAAQWQEPAAPQQWSAAPEPAAQWQEPAAPQHWAAAQEPAPAWPQQEAPAPEWSEAAPAAGSAWSQPPAPAVPEHEEAKPAARKFGLFGRKKPDDTAAEAAPVESAPAATWQPTGQEASAQPQGTGQAPAPTWAPASAPEPAGYAPSSFAPASQAFEPPRSEYYAPTEPVPVQPAAAPAATGPGATRVSLDDDVAAMLALRSDIEEQALAELSQLSAYRPSMGGSNERLTRRVPTAVPVAVPGAGAAPIRRDADELRSRLSSFQSGTSRGRRASVDTQGA